MEIKNKSDNKAKRKLQQQVNHQCNKLTKIRQKNEDMQIEQKMTNNDEPTTQINVKAVLASYYIGSSGLDVGSVANFLGVPGGKYWEREYSRKSPHAANKIIELVDTIVYDSMVVEISLRIREMMKNIISDIEIEKNIEYFKQGEYSKMHKDLHHIGISVSYDMGWQKRATGRIYDSLSGHGFFVGCLSKNVVQYGLLKKKCSICNRQNNLSLSSPHKCLVNWSGSSGAMEAALAFDFVIKIDEMFKGLVYIKEIITDDDSTMRAHLKNITNGGKLPDHILQAIFLADPSHRVKVMCKPIFAMVTNTKDPDKCKNVDATRIKRYTSYYIRQNRSRPLVEFVANAKAPIEHLFNDHSWCDASWCWSKELQEGTHKIVSVLTKRKVSDINVTK